MNIQCLDAKWLYESVMAAKLLSIDEKYIISKSMTKKLQNTTHESLSQNEFRFDSMISSDSEVDLSAVVNDGLDWIVSCDSCVTHTSNQTQINSKFSNTETTRNENSFKLPFPVSESTRKVLEKLQNQTKNQRTESHKSLGERLNEKISIEWSNEYNGDSPSQRPYKSIYNQSRNQRKK